MLTKAGIEKLKRDGYTMDLDLFEAVCDMALSSLSGGWRPISEALPGDTPLLLFAFGECEVGYFDTVEGTWKNNKGFETVPTHFQLLPSPPQVSQEGE